MATSGSAHMPVIVDLRVGADDRVDLVRPVLVADHRPAAGLQADLPEHGVARQADVVAAAADVLLDRGALPGGPVLVVADAEHEVVAGSRFRNAFEVARHRVVELESLLLGPLDEAAFVGEPSGRAHEPRIAVGESVLLVDQPVDVGLFAAVGRAAPCDRRVRSTVASTSRARTAGRTTPASRRCRGSCRPSCCTRCRCWSRARAAPAPAAARRGPRSRVADGAIGGRVVSGERDEVEAAAPRLVDRHGRRRRASHIRWRRRRRGRLFDALEIGGCPHQLVLRAPAMDRDVVAIGAGRDVQRHRVARRVAELAAVRLDRVVASDVVGHCRSP